MTSVKPLYVRVYFHRRLNVVISFVLSVFISITILRTRRSVHVVLNILKRKMIHHIVAHVGLLLVSVTVITVRMMDVLVVVIGGVMVIVMMNLNVLVDMMVVEVIVAHLAVAV